MASVAVTNVRKAFGALKAIQDLSVDSADGEIHSGDPAFIPLFDLAAGKRL